MRIERLSYARDERGRVVEVFLVLREAEAEMAEVAKALQRLLPGVFLRRGPHPVTLGSARGERPARKLEYLGCCWRGRIYLVLIEEEDLKVAAELPPELPKRLVKALREMGAELSPQAAQAYRLTHSSFAVWQTKHPLPSAPPPPAIMPS